MVIREKCEAPVFGRAVKLLDGSEVYLRPISSSDKPTLQMFFDRLSPETRYLRFHYSKCQLTDNDLSHECDLDYSEELGLVAEKERGGQKEIVGVGRYTRIPSSYSAEVAFVVEDQEQSRGIGTHLLRELGKLAWQRGIVQFIAELMSDNVKMLSIFRKYDRNLLQEVDGGSCRVTFSV